VAGHVLEGDGGSGDRPAGGRRAREAGRAAWRAEGKLAVAATTPTHDDGDDQGGKNTAAKQQVRVHGVASE
jgi:hypothetical protein